MLSLGYGFVEYLHKASADKAIRKLQHVKVKLLLHTARLTNKKIMLFNEQKCQADNN